MPSPLNRLQLSDPCHHACKQACSITTYPPATQLDSLNAPFRKNRQSIGSSPHSSPLSQPGHGVHWDVSQTKGSTAAFSLGSSTMVQRSGASLNSVGTHLGSNTGQGLVSATYSPLSHQGSLLRKDVDNQKNLRQADLNSVKRTPLSLKVCTNTA